MREECVYSVAFCETWFAVSHPCLSLSLSLLQFNDKTVYKQHTFAQIHFSTLTWLCFCPCICPCLCLLISGPAYRCLCSDLREETASEVIFIMASAEALGM